MILPDIRASRRVLPREESWAFWSTSIGPRAHGLVCAHVHLEAKRGHLAATRFLG